MSAVRKCRPRFHSVCADLCHRPSRTLSCGWIASEIDVHEDSGFVIMFLSSEMCCCFGFPRQDTMLAIIITFLIPGEGPTVTVMQYYFSGGGTPVTVIKINFPRRARL